MSDKAKDRSDVASSDDGQLDLETAVENSDKPSSADDKGRRDSAREPGADRVSKGADEATERKSPFTSYVFGGGAYSHAEDEADWSYADADFEVHGRL